MDTTGVKRLSPCRDDKGLHSKKSKKSTTSGGIARDVYGRVLCSTVADQLLKADCRLPPPLDMTGPGTADTIEYLITGSDYDISTTAKYTSFPGYWVGKETTPIRCDAAVLRAFNREFPRSMIGHEADVGLLLAFLGDRQFNVLQTVFRETSSHVQTQEEFSPTLMYLVDTWGGMYGFVCARKDRSPTITPLLRERPGVKNAMLATKMQAEWESTSVIQSPLDLLYQLIIRSPLYNNKLAGSNADDVNNEAYRLRWFNLLCNWSKLTQVCSTDPATLHSLVCVYKTNFQQLSGLSLKPGVIWTSDEVSQIGFDVSREVRDLLQGAALRKMTTGSNTPYNLTTHDVTRLRDSLMKYDFNLLQQADKMQPEDDINLDETCCAAVLLVQLLIGSRFIEVLSVSDYYTRNNIKTPPKTMKDNELIIHKVIKSNKEVSLEKDPVSDTSILQPKPVLFGYHPDTIIGLVYTCIRPYLNHVYQGDRQVSAAEIAHRFHPIAIRVLQKALGNKYMNRVKTYNDIIRTHGRGKGPPTMVIGTQLMRKVYANYSYDTLSTQGTSRNAWIQRVLGYNRASLSSIIACSNLVILKPSTDDQTLHDETEESSLKIELKRMHNLMKRISTQVHRNTSIIQLGSKIAVINRDGEEVFIDRLPRVRGKQLHQAIRVCRQMKSYNVKITTTLLRRFGYGSAIACKAIQLVENDTTSA